MRRLLVLVVVVGALAGCGGGGSGESSYERFTVEAKRLDGAEVLGEADASARAAMLCASTSVGPFGGTGLADFPTDLALVRAYCPEREDDLS